MAQEGDVLLFQTVDDGEMSIVNGTTEMTGSFITMVYLCLFGGNEDDDGSDNNPNNWWGNLDELDTANQYRSETQNLLMSIPATSGNLLRIKNAVIRDLSVFTEKKIASTVTVEVTIPGLNKVNIAGNIEAVGLESNFNFTENWKAAA